MGNFQWLNLAILANLIFTTAYFLEVGRLFDGLVDLFILAFSALLALSFFDGLAGVIQRFMVVNIWMAYMMAFWAIFAASFFLLINAKTRIVTEERFVTFAGLDNIGSILTGVASGMVVSGMLLLTVHLFPLPENIDRKCRFLRRPVIFNADRTLPRLYGYFVKNPGGYNSQAFALRYHHSYYLKTIEDRKRQEQEAEKGEDFYGR